MIKVLLVDSFMWAVIILGMIVGVEYVDSLAPFVVWAVAVLMVVSGAFLMFMPEESAKKADGGDRSKTREIYGVTSMSLKVVVIASLGGYWLAGTLLTGLLFSLAGVERVKGLRNSA